MKFFKKMKDGGPESSVTGWWLVEIKSLFSIVLLKFDGQSREAFHEHAFNCLNWLIKGSLYEIQVNGKQRWWKPSIIPFVIRRKDFHKVSSGSTSWLLSIRGPWSDTWREMRPLEGNRIVTLTHGRQEICG